jgi:hypothetical protein
MKIERAASFVEGKITIEKGCHLALIHEVAGEETFERYTYLSPGDVLTIERR